MSEWQTIDTAPKDGTLVLLWDDDVNHPVVANWSKNHGVFVEQYGGQDPDKGADIVGDTIYLPTHWMPLPSPPTS